MDGQNLLELKGRKLADYRLKQIGFVWQQVDRNLLPHRSARANVELPMMLAGVPVWRRGKRAMELLEAVGLADQANQKPASLSGGQQQRVAIAVALANRPKLLLADEPTGSLDAASAEQVMDLIGELRQTLGLTILMVTHDMEIADYADRVLTLRDGALGQDLSGVENAGPQLDNAGRIQLPEAVRENLAAAARIAVEVRPEGVLLRPERDEMDETDALLDHMLPQDAPPERGGIIGALRRIFRHFSNRMESPPLHEAEGTGGEGI
jgi:ABC-type lipoprotein export system ATPase subunit